MMVELRRHQVLQCPSLIFNPPWHVVVFVAAALAC